MIVFGIVGGPLAALLIAAVPEVAKKPQYIEIGKSAAILVRNIGMYFSGQLFPGFRQQRDRKPQGIGRFPSA